MLTKLYYTNYVFFLNKQIEIKENFDVTKNKGILKNNISHYFDSLKILKDKDKIFGISIYIETDRYKKIKKNKRLYFSEIWKKFNLRLKNSSTKCNSIINGKNICITYLDEIKTIIIKGIYYLRKLIEKKDMVEQNEENICSNYNDYNDYLFNNTLVNNFRNKNKFKNIRLEINEKNKENKENKEIEKEKENLCNGLFKTSRKDFNNYEPIRLLFLKNKIN